MSRIPRMRHRHLRTEHRVRWLQRFAAATAAAIGVALVSAVPASAAGTITLRGSVPSLGGTAGGGAQVSLVCFSDAGVETRTIGAAADGSWSTTVDATTTSCSLSLTATPLGGQLQYEGWITPTGPETVLDLTYPAPATLTVVPPPAGWAQPTGTAWISSELYTEGIAGQQGGRLFTIRNFDPTAGPVTFLVARGQTQYDVRLTNGFHVDNIKHLSQPAPDSFVITIPRTRTLTATGQLIGAPDAVLGGVRVTCEGKDLEGSFPLTGSTYTFTTLNEDYTSCRLTYTTYDPARTVETTGERPITFVDGIAHADVVAPPLKTITVLDADGQPVSGARLTWQANASVDLPDGARADLGSYGDRTLTGAPLVVPVPEQDVAVGFQVTFDSGEQYATEVDVVGRSAFTITLPPRVAYDITGTIDGVAGATGTAYLACGSLSANAPLSSDGSFALHATGYAVPQCHVDAFVQIGPDAGSSTYSYYSIGRYLPVAAVDGVVTGTVRFALPEPIEVHAVGPDGAPTSLNGNVSTTSYDVVMPDGAHGSLSAQHYGQQTTAQPLSLRLPTDASGGYYWTDGDLYSAYGSLTVPAGATAMTFVAAQPGRWISGPPAGNVDADGVPGLVEAGAPNAGDGNGDGIADAEQPDVASLPAAAGGGYLTLASPAGTTVGPVSTRTLEGLPAPPAGTALPAGLVGFEIRGVTPGGTATVRIHSSLLAGVTGWAKFHGGTWAVLPAADVTVDAAAGYLDVTLTDGGPFDDDGAANGTIVDPGGPALTDSTPPTVVCAAAPPAWSADDVALACTASDEGTGLAQASDASFSLTTSVPAGTETANASTGSRQVCDVAGNCATAGPVVGIKVDRLAPSISIAQPVAGGTVTQGAAPAAAYSCTDGGSGTGTCSGDVAVGQPVPTTSTGAATFTVTATDAVGNSTTSNVGYTVVSANTAPVVAADMGVTGLETIGTQSGSLQLTARFTDAEGNGPFTATVQWSPGSPFRPATVTGSTLAATGSWPSAGTRMVTVRVCDAAGACGTDTLSVRSHVRERVEPATRCVVDQGRAASPRYVGRFGYTSKATIPLWIPVLPGLENTFLKDPARRGQPTVFLPGTQRTVFEIGFGSGTQSWRLNGDVASVSSSTRRC